MLKICTAFISAVFNWPELCTQTTRSTEPNHPQSLRKAAGPRCGILPGAGSEKHLPGRGSVLTDTPETVRRPSPVTGELRAAALFCLAVKDPRRLHVNTSTQPMRARAGGVIDTVRGCCGGWAFFVLDRSLRLVEKLRENPMIRCCRVRLKSLRCCRGEEPWRF